MRADSLYFVKIIDYHSNSRRLAGSFSPSRKRDGTTGSPAPRLNVIAGPDEHPPNKLETPT